LRTDTIFYQLFQTFNNLLFELLDQPSDPTYQFVSVEVKERAFRFDGIFTPPLEATEKLIYFVEVQFQPKSSFYDEFLGEVFLYLSQFTPQNDWKAIAIFPKRSLEPLDITKFQTELIDSNRIARIYLNEITTESSIAIGIIQLITSTSQDAPALVDEIKTKIGNQNVSQDIMELIETVLLYKFKNLNRREIEAMFTLADLKETRVYQEAYEEGKLEGELKGVLKGKLENARQIAKNMLDAGMSVDQIARFTGLTIEEVHQL
jgi:predicted transposase/invertase (TIGR01784 family)